MCAFIERLYESFVGVLSRYSRGCGREYMIQRSRICWNQELAEDLAVVRMFFHVGEGWSLGLL